MNLIVRLAALGLASGFPHLASAAICNQNTYVKSLIPSAGDVGFVFDTAVAGCSCTSNVAWIDSGTVGGRAMYALALTAKLNAKPVFVTVQDGLGQGAAGNDAITYRFWATCEVKAIELTN